MGYAVFVFGPAGSGKSTLCKSLSEHVNVLHRKINIINFDPAQISKDEYILDIRDYITTTEIMNELDLGPNGSLIEAYKQLSDNLEELDLEDYSDEYLIFDCPGQIELFMHSNILIKIINYISRYCKCSILYLLESQCVLDISKFMGNIICYTISMSRFNYKILLVLSKVDLVDKEYINKFIDNLEENVNNNKFYKRIYELCNFNFKMLDYSDEDSLNNLLYYIDESLQYYDDEDVIERE